jgi:hypothetical protein
LQFSKADFGGRFFLRNGTNCKSDLTLKDLPLFQSIIAATNASQCHFILFLDQSTLITPLSLASATQAAIKMKSNHLIAAISGISTVSLPIPPPLTLKTHDGQIYSAGCEFLLIPTRDGDAVAPLARLRGARAGDARANVSTDLACAPLQGLIVNRVAVLAVLAASEMELATDIVRGSLGGA